MSLNNPICNHTLWCLSISFLTSQAHASPAELPNSSEVRLRKTASHPGSLSSARPCDWTEFTFHLQEARLTPMACQKKWGEIWASWMCSGEHSVLEFSAGQTNALSLHSAEQDLRKQRPICSLLIYTDSKQVQKDYEISFLHNCTRLSLFFFLKEKTPTHYRCIL